MNASWDSRCPGVSFSFKHGKITVFSRTLSLLGMPEFYRFLFNPEAGRFAVQACGIDAEGAKQRPVFGLDRLIEIRDTELVRLMYSTCGWSTTYSYRVGGELFSKEQLVEFDLQKAIPIHEGRIMRLDG